MDGDDCGWVLMAGMLKPPPPWGGPPPPPDRKPCECECAGSAA